MPSQERDEQKGLPLPRVRLGDEVYDQLVSRLLSHQLAPGDRITVDALSRELGVSQTPIREALTRMEAGGVVVRTHLAGYRVAPELDRRSFDDLVELRLLLEPVAAQHAAERTTPEQLDALRELASAMEAQESGPDGTQDYAAFAGLDARFHDAVAEAAGSALLREALARLHTHLKLFRLSSGRRVLTEALAEHRAVVDAVAAGDPDAAAAAMREHVERSAARFSAFFS
ncbi:GntR family transcriptional regulator [Streptomyces sp. NP160]|uniref:GntR family transcriptional regulator n=1 Tax=Streptomyces sp. NP160 TaxID=2586637 RepID=UPI001119BCB7|nr:GntR family transcriptional regulator [Streptomyces sp. NP160]TNM69618.1 GntR family transcriptional regulator [Streptomyces sp. NP160]